MHTSPLRRNKSITKLNIMETVPEKIFLVGGAGRIGLSFLHRLKNEHVSVTALAADKKERKKLKSLVKTVVCKSLEDYITWQDYLNGQNVMIYCEQDVDKSKDPFDIIQLSEELFILMHGIAENMKLPSFLYISKEIKQTDKFHFLPAENPSETIRVKKKTFSLINMLSAILLKC